MQQKRLIIALLISTAILFLWSYLVPVQQQKPNPSPQSPSPQASTPQQTVTPPDGPATVPSPVPAASPAAAASNAAPHRTLLIKTPLYEAKLDSRGAEAISWIIKQNKDSGREIYSVAGAKSARVPLELVSPEGLKRVPREAPLQLVTGDAAVDSLLASANYALEGVDPGAGDFELTLGADEKKRISFVLRDSSTGLDVVKTIVLDAASYSADLEVTIKRGDKIVPQARVRVGPSIGDQGVKHHTFYSVAPEAVAAIGDRVERHQPQSINANKNTPDYLALPGPVEWAGVGDTYFAMVAVPSKKLDGLELRTTQYTYSGNGKPESRYLITAWVPVSPDGSRTVVYTGPKDHFILQEANTNISQAVEIGRAHV